MCQAGPRWRPNREIAKHTERLLLRVRYTISERSHSNSSESSSPWEKRLKQGCQPPTSSNIENWWGRDDRWRHNARHITSFVKKKKRAKRCCWNCSIWPNWFTSHQSYYCLYYNGLQEFVRKIAQATQNIWNFIVTKSNPQETTNFGDYPGDFRL